MSFAASLVSLSVHLFRRGVARGFEQFKQRAWSPFSIDVDGLNSGDVGQILAKHWTSWKD
jgi:hypothetical protein